MKENKKIYFVGAGPGDPKLITLKGKELIAAADTIVYAGSLINPELLTYAKKEVDLYDSAKMTLEEITQVLISSYKAKKCTVRLASGDPTIFSAIDEMDEILQNHEIEIEVVPGVSSFVAAASSLKLSLTVPDVAQTVILTRGEGRTKMPLKEKLKDLAQHQSTLILFLSAALAKSVQEDLLTAYPPQTPIAICYKTSWQDQKIFRGTLEELEQIMRREKITMTALILVGQFLTAAGHKSKLYDKTFTHAYRKALSPS